MALTANATLASKYNPSGIIPITAATIDVTLERNPSPWKKKACTNKRIPIGIIAIPATSTNLSRAYIISDCSLSCISFACKVNFEI